MAGKTVLLIALFLLAFGIPINAEKGHEQKIAELEKKLETVSGREKVEVLTQLASGLYTSDPGKCIRYCNQALRLAERLDYPEEKAWALICKGYALDVQGERKKNVEYGKAALRIFERLGNKKGIAEALNAVGYFYLQRDFYNIALEYFLKALETFEELGREKKLVEVYWNLGNLYYILKDDRKALLYFQNGLKILEKEGHNSLKAPYLHNIAMVYRLREDFQKALQYFRLAQKTFEASGNRYWLSATSGNIGETFKRLNQNKKALAYFHKSQKINEDLRNKAGLCYNFQCIGDVYLKMKAQNKALTYYDRAFEIASGLNDNSLLEQVYLKYSDLYAAKGNYKKAYKYHKLYTKTKNAIIDEKKNKQIAEMQEKYDTEKKSRQIAFLEKENEIQKVTRNALVAIVVMAAIIMFLLFKKYLYLFAFWKKQKYIGGYRLTESIGSGGMGTVYHAHNIRDKSETAAIKVLNDEFFKDESCRKRFKHEGTIIESLDHPNIVKIYERGEYKDKLYIAMEYLQGKTLAQNIREHDKIDLGQCFHIMAQAADALVCIHGKSIVHRDLKPENIMLIRRDGNPDMVKMLDFGLARARFQSRLTRTGVLVGTVTYMSPEQVSGQPSTAASDIYALGIVFYEMLTGHHVFQGETITDIADKILTVTPGEPQQCRPEIPDEINRLIMKMLSKKPGDRPSAELVFETVNKVAGVG